jgi:hypothetical protein
MMHSSARRLSNPADRSPTLNPDLADHLLYIHSFKLFQKHNVRLAHRSSGWFNVGAESRYDSDHDRDVVCVICEDITQMHQSEMSLSEAIAEMHLASRLLGLSGQVFPHQFQNSGRVKSIHKDGSRSFPIRLFK